MIARSRQGQFRLFLGHLFFDGLKQRQALTAAEQALRALGARSSDKARSSAAKAVGLDQIGIYGGLVDAVEPLAADLDAGNDISDGSWDDLAATVGMGPLTALIDELRS